MNKIIEDALHECNSLPELIAKSGELKRKYPDMVEFINSTLNNEKQRIRNNPAGFVKVSTRNYVTNKRDESSELCISVEHLGKPYIEVFKDIIVI